MNIGILGGTFDPIHFVHLMIAEQVREEVNLDQIWFLPTNIPPHKEGRTVTSAHHRLEMVKLAIQGISYFQVKALEFERSGPSYTIETVRELNRTYPRYNFSFIIGGDMVDYLPQWKNIEELIDLIQFIGVQRPGYQQDESPFSTFVQKVEIPQMDISSTMIREKVQNVKSIRFLVPDRVRNYIEENSLYET